MTFDLEIMLRNGEHVFADVLTHDRPATEWTVADAEAVLEKILVLTGPMSGRSACAA